MPKALLVVVRYGTPLEESPAMQSLAACFAAEPELEQCFSALVWDNSPSSQEAPPYRWLREYRHTGANVGLSAAYNYGMVVAEQHGDTWLLLLDQDTTLPPDFLTRMHAYAMQQEPDASVAAVAPTVLMGTQVVSPKITARWESAFDAAPGFCGKELREVILVNSGLLLRVSALRTIGGYSEDFWLDFSDRYLCHMLAQHGFAVWLAGDVQLQHRVSLMAGGAEMSAARYQNLLAAQDAYFDLYQSPARNAVFCVRLLRSALSERSTHPERSRLLRRQLMRRLLVGRARRLVEWRASVSAHRWQGANPGGQR